MRENPKIPYRSKGHKLVRDSTSLFYVVAQEARKFITYRFVHVQLSWMWPAQRCLTKRGVATKFLTGAH